MRTKFLAGLVLALLCGSADFCGRRELDRLYLRQHVRGERCNANHADCARKCVKEHGAKYVFVNDADKKVYAIDAQDKVAAHAGHHVTVKGSVDGDNLKLTSIEMAK